MSKGKKTRRPAVRMTTASLLTVSVDLVSIVTTTLRCRQCGSVWSPNLLPAGRLPRNWWHCPAGCNARPEDRT